MQLRAFSLQLAHFIFVIHLNMPPPTDKCSNNFNGHGEKEYYLEISIWTQHDVNVAFDAGEPVRVLTDKSSTCVYTAFSEAFSLMSVMGCLNQCL